MDFQRVGHHRGILPVHRGVIVAAEQEDGAAHLVGMQLHGERVAHGEVVLAALTEQTAAGAFVDVWLAHSHNRVDGRPRRNPLPRRLSSLST